jgi:hypothetical protein
MIKGPVIAVGVAVGVGADGSAMIASGAPADGTGVGVNGAGDDVGVGAADVTAVTKDHLLWLRIAVPVVLLISVVRVAR